MELFVIRHTSVSGTSGLCYGQSEVPLADSFDAETAILLQAFSEPADVIFTSPLERCRRLAERLPAAKRISDDRLKEVFFGEWEGRQWDELPEADVRAWADDFVYARPPGGESLISLAARAADFLEELRGQPYKRVAVVTHAGFVRCVWAHLLGIPLSHIFRLDIPYGHGHRFGLGTSPAFDRWQGSFPSVSF
jgi:alpha-ribazole phosphatase